MQAKCQKLLKNQGFIEDIDNILKWKQLFGSKLCSRNNIKKYLLLFEIENTEKGPKTN